MSTSRTEGKSLNNERDQGNGAESRTRRHIRVRNVAKIVGLQTKLPPTIERSKDRPKIQNLRKIQDSYDVVTREDTRGMAKETTLSSTKKERWKDDADTITATKMNRIA